MLQHARAWLAGFATEPASHRPLGVLRIGIAVALIAEAAAIAKHLQEYFGPLGLVQDTVAEALSHPYLPSLQVLARGLSFAGAKGGGTVYAAFIAYVIALHLLLLGYRTRTAAVATWLLFLALKRSGSASVYGAFELAHIGLFYCAVFPAGGALSLDALRRSVPPSATARVALRVLQLHLCIVYLSSGVEKACGEQWWNGEAIWRAVMRPGHVWLDFSWLASHPLLAATAGWATLVLELGYAFLVWPRRTGRLWIVGTIGLHLAIAVVLGLLFFSAVMIVFNVAAFLVPASADVGLSRSSGGAADREIAHRHAGCPIPGRP